MNPTLFGSNPEKRKPRKRGELELLMKRLVSVFSLALLIGLFALPGSVMLSYGAGNSGDQEQATVPESNQEQATAPKVQEQATAPKVQEQATAPKVQEQAAAPKAEEQAAAPKAQGKVTTKSHHRKTAAHHRHYRNYRDYDRTYNGYDRGYYDPYYNGYYYPRNYYYGPGLSIDVPFFGIRIN